MIKKCLARRQNEAAFFVHVSEPFLKITGGLSSGAKMTFSVITPNAAEIVFLVTVLVRNVKDIKGLPKK